MLDKALKSELLQSAARRVRSGGVLQLTGVWGSAPALIAAALGKLCDKPVLLIVNHLDDADAMADDIEVFLNLSKISKFSKSSKSSKSSKKNQNSKGLVHQFPAWEAQLASDHISREVTAQRQRLLNLLAQPAEHRDEPLRYIVAPIMAVLQPVPTPDALAAGRLTLRRSAKLPLDDLLAWLVDAGYEHVDQVDQQGDFAHRGGIVDVFPPGANFAVRLEYFGDELESIRKFDLDTQRSTDQIEAYDLPSLNIARPICGTAAPGCDSVILPPHPTATAEGGYATQPPHLRSTAEGGYATQTSESHQITHFLDYLPDETICCMVEPGELHSLAGQLYDRVRNDLTGEGSPVALRKVDEIFDALARLARVDMHLFAGKHVAQPRAAMPQTVAQSPLAGEEAALQMGVRSLDRLAINTASALGELEELTDGGDVWVFCDSLAEQQRFAQMLSEQHPQLGRAVKLGLGHITEGFNWPEPGLVVVGHHEIYHRYSKLRRVRSIRAGRAIESMLDLREGDYVVHVARGIAKFEGLRRMQRDGVDEEYIRLKFAEGAALHIPASQINLVQKYIGARGNRPTLSKLGGTLWARTKEKVTDAVDDLAAEMLRIQAMREASPGYSHPQTTEMQRQFAEEFIYSETEDQLSAISQLDSDMSLARPMDRLICGDVGYGKTEIAMRAAMKVVEAGRQVAVLVPTTVLADQHYRTFSQRFADFPVRVEMLSRFRTPKQQREIIKKLTLGQIDILIGTHRILSKDVKFPSLGMVVIDEEQRFGVAAKEHLKSLRATVDVLTLTATPIPRTLHMALLGLRDICSLQTPPMDRRAIHTEVTPVDDSLIRSAILRELNRDGQVFFVHNRVQDIEALASHVQSLASEARIEIAHGQMPHRQLQRVMTQFTRSQIDILVCTTIIESGLDIPSANTMIINEADRFGLADLHQLRGRVGRYKHRAYCYLLLPQRRSVSPVAARRLKAIEDFSDLGAGFQIAMRDLEIRGAGNILGSQQSGYIAAVGYELYCRLLEQSVCKLRGEKPPPVIDVHVELGIEAYIPRSYIPSERQRMEIYRRVVHCFSGKELKQLRDDLDDAFGEHPPQVNLLLDVAELRICAAAVGIKSIILMPPDIILRVADHKLTKPIFDTAAGSVRLPDSKSIYWRPPKPYLEMPTLLNVLLNRFRQAAE